MPSVESAVLAKLVASRAEHEPSRLAFVFENNRFPEELVRYQDLAVKSKQLAHELKRAGFSKGDRVAIMLRNHPEFLYALVANSQLGIATVPIDPRSRGHKLFYYLTFAECTGLITADYVVSDPAAADVISRTGVKTYVVSTFEGRSDGLDVSRLWPTVNEVLAGPEFEDGVQHVDDIRDPWLLAYTSGTTGDPKAIIFSYDRMLFYRHVPAFFGYRPDDVLYTGLSLTHGNSLVATMMPALWGDVSHSVFSRWFTKSRLWDICTRYGCTSWSNLGGIATAVYSEPKSSKDRGHKVRLVVSAGMPTPLWRPFEKRFGVSILEWYGTMEGGFAWNPPNVGPVGSFGKPPEQFLEMRVVDDQDGEVPPDALGELVVKPVGRPAKLDYFRDPAASEKKTRSGWLHTGDIVWRDENGWLFFAFRKEEGGIRKMGEFVSEGFIRVVLAEDPGVLDVHVYGIPSRTGAAGESDIVAAIVVRDKEAFEVNALFERCRRQLESSHIPDYIQIVDELPKTASEKVQIRFLASALDFTSPYLFSRTPGE